MRMGHTSYAHPGQGLSLRISSGPSRRARRSLLRICDLVIVSARLAVPAGVALVTELPGRLVTQRTVWTHRVVFAPEPISFLLRVTLVLELFPLQELVAE